MFKRLACAFICISVLIIQSHDVVLHKHDLPHEHQNATYHDDESHNAFSSIDIDEEFTLDNKIDINISFVATLSPKTIEITLHNPMLINLFVIKNEYPPPKSIFFFKSLRAPPINFFC